MCRSQPYPWPTQMKAKFYKEQTRIHKQHYMALTATPVGAIPNCPVCGECEASPACDSSGCEICEASPTRDLEEAVVPARHLLQADTCPSCPACNEATNSTFSS